MLVSSTKINDCTETRILGPVRRICRSGSVSNTLNLITTNITIRGLFAASRGASWRRLLRVEAERSLHVASGGGTHRGRFQRRTCNRLGSYRNLQRALHFFRMMSGGPYTLVPGTVWLQSRSSRSSTHPRPVIPSGCCTWTFQSSHLSNRSWFSFWCLSSNA